MNDQRKESAAGQPTPSSLNDLAREGSALSQALDISRYAVSCGFEWRDVQGVWEKVYEEIDEFKEATTPHDKELEFGDILFSLVNVARWSGVDPEAALLATCDKFRDRWSSMEVEAKEKGQTLDALGPEMLMELWKNAKRLELGSDQRNS
ncbi:MAG: MazG nucleotide pyrophosphohydrolase domain-containing protein [Coriobacteriia bacterium]|nr:MazG nucleotide pyrophosphohydrolase domain-containing protein [Coriobacteriia bacterium]